MTTTTTTTSSTTIVVSLAVVVVTTATIFAAVFVANTTRKKLSSTTSRRCRRHRTLQRRHFAWTTAFSCSSFWIHNVRVPVASLPSDMLTQADEEGLVNCHIRIEAGQIDKIIAVAAAAADDDDDASAVGSWLLSGSSLSSLLSTNVDGHGCIMMPCFVDVHTHLIKTQTVPRNRNVTGTMGEALAVEAADQHQNWANVEAVTRLMDFGIQCAVHHGTKALRTHLDGCSAANTFVADDDDDDNVQAMKVVHAVYQAYDTLVAKYKQQGIVLQGVANLWLPLWLREPLATEHANRAAQHSNVLLGAYVGNPPTEERTQTIRAMKALFQHAHRLGLDVDMHIDESNDPACCSLLSLIEALQYARHELRYVGKVVLGHCCALSLQDKDTQVHVCQQLAQLKAYVVANPFTNVGLQDRRGSNRPLGLPIPADVPRTPQWRGLTLVQELEAAGVVVSVASDNVRDHWHPYGDFDLLSVWTMALLLGHLDTVPSAGAWAKICSDAPAQAMGLSSRFEVGHSADGIFFPQARRISELLARPQVDRIVMRNGKFQTTPLPDFRDLDDLVSISTPRPPPQAFFEQSAT